MPTIAAGTPTESPNYEAVRAPISREIRIHHRIDATAPQLWTLTQRHFVVGGQHLVLDEPPQIAVYSSSFEFEVVGWGIRLPFGAQGQIGREVIRKFLKLHVRAEENSLNEQEEAEWADISKRVDYRRFSLDRTPLRYVDGVLLSRDGDAECRVEWHTGEKERVLGKLALAFSIFELGERFTGLAKFGEGNNLIEITHLSPAPDLTEPDEGERMWREWPVNR
jgi:hypothetical protein